MSSFEDMLENEAPGKLHFSRHASTPTQIIHRHRTQNLSQYPNSNEKKNDSPNHSLKPLVLEAFNLISDSPSTKASTLAKMFEVSKSHIQEMKLQHSESNSIQTPPHVRMNSKSSSLSTAAADRAALAFIQQRSCGSASKLIGLSSPHNYRDSLPSSRKLLFGNGSNHQLDAGNTQSEHESIPSKGHIGFSASNIQSKDHLEFTGSDMDVLSSISDVPGLQENESPFPNLSCPFPRPFDVTSSQLNPHILHLDEDKDLVDSLSLDLHEINSCLHEESKCLDSLTMALSELDAFIEKLNYFESCIQSSIPGLQVMSSDISIEKRQECVRRCVNVLQNARTALLQGELIQTSENVEMVKQTLRHEQSCDQTHLESALIHINDARELLENVDQRVSAFCLDTSQNKESSRFLSPDVDSPNNRVVKKTDLTGKTNLSSDTRVQMTPKMQSMTNTISSSDNTLSSIPLQQESIYPQGNHVNPVIGVHNDSALQYDDAQMTKDSASASEQATKFGKISDHGKDTHTYVVNSVQFSHGSTVENVHRHVLEKVGGHHDTVNLRLQSGGSKQQLEIVRESIATSIDAATLKEKSSAQKLPSDIQNRSTSDLSNLNLQTDINSDDAYSFLDTLTPEQKSFESSDERSEHKSAPSENTTPSDGPQASKQKGFQTGFSGSEMAYPDLELDKPNTDFIDSYGQDRNKQITSQVKPSSNTSTSNPDVGRAAAYVDRANRSVASSQRLQEDPLALDLQLMTGAMISDDVISSLDTPKLQPKTFGDVGEDTASRIQAKHSNREAGEGIKHTSISSSLESSSSLSATTASSIPHRPLTNGMNNKVLLSEDGESVSVKAGAVPSLGASVHRSDDHSTQDFKGDLVEPPPRRFSLQAEDCAAPESPGRSPPGAALFYGSEQRASHQDDDSGLGFKVGIIQSGDLDAPRDNLLVMDGDGVPWSDIVASPIPEAGLDGEGGLVVPAYTKLPSLMQTTKKKQLFSWD